MTGQIKLSLVILLTMTFLLPDNPRNIAFLSEGIRLPQPLMYKVKTCYFLPAISLQKGEKGISDIQHSIIVGSDSLLCILNQS